MYLVHFREQQTVKKRYMINKNITMRIFYILSILVLFASCNREKTGDLVLNFRPIYNNEPLVMAEDLIFRPDYELRIDKSNFYISNVYIINADGESVELSEVEFVDLSFFDLNSSLEGTNFTYKDLPVGNYTAIRMTIGVTPGLNATKPQDYPSTHPLSLSSQYWESWGSYIFSKTEGAVDTLQDGSFDHKFAYHTGSDALARTIEYPYSFDIKEDGTTERNFVLDHYDLFKEGAGLMDIKNIPSNHTPEDLDNMEKIVDNFVTSLKIVL